MRRLREATPTGIDGRVLLHAVTESRRSTICESRDDQSKVLERSPEYRGSRLLAVSSGGFERRRHPPINDQ